MMLEKSTQLNLAKKILSILFNYRRSLADAHEYRHNCEQCNHPHLERIEDLVSTKQPIHMVLPGFPAKSPNHDKVLGTLPDKGERISLHFLNILCESITSIYPPGAKITICSDGHVFSDLIGVLDTTVSTYNQKIAEIIKKDNLINLSMFGLSDIFDHFDIHEKRIKFIENCSQSYEEIKQLIKTTPRELLLFNGIEKFLLEDFAFLEPSLSKNALRKKVHALTYRIIQRSHGWSSMVEKHFPNAIRLSIHPQPCHFHKLGIYLIETKNNWLTPWHGVTVLKNGKFELMKKYQVPLSSAKLVIEDEYPSYFIV